ncbi:hypothetical protein Tco_1090803 [Tanacetum coccineum]|uniref:Retrovirus-related Pol polyprotein from transposon TNT 1-94-like beta-barrel domain-containing protein n=1 Tax=Tanacetum coccineum TaxID=301880 RepID=A0ABQ5I5B5_9ASTR
MTGDRSRLRIFIKKFIGTVRFRNDHFGAIMGYGDYVIGNSVISRVYYVEGLRHNLFSVGQFCDSDLEVAFRKHSCYVRDTDGVDIIKGTDNQEKDEKQSQNDKTGLGMEKTVKDKAKSKPESQSSQKVNRKVNWSKSKSTQVNPGAKVILIIAQISPSFSKLSGSVN